MQTGVGDSHDEDRVSETYAGRVEDVLKGEVREEQRRPVGRARRALCIVQRRGA